MDATLLRDNLYLRFKNVFLKNNFLIFFSFKLILF